MVSLIYESGINNYLLFFNFETAILFDTVYECFESIYQINSMNSEEKFAIVEGTIITILESHINCTMCNSNTPYFRSLNDDKCLCMVGYYDDGTAEC